MEDVFLSKTAIKALLGIACVVLWAVWHICRVNHASGVLDKAVERGDLREFRIAVQRKNELLRKTPELACEVLGMIIRHNRPELLPTLMEYQKAKDLQHYSMDNMDPSCLLPVIEEGSPEMLEAMLQAGFDPACEVESLWMACCVQRKMAHARVLARHGYDTLTPVQREVLDESGESSVPLHAVLTGAYEEPQVALAAIRYLVCEHGDDVNSLTPDGRTAMDLLEEEPLKDCEGLEPIRNFLRGNGGLNAADLTH